MFSSTPQRGIFREPNPYRRIEYIALSNLFAVVGLANRFSTLSQALAARDELEQQEKAARQKAIAMEHAVRLGNIAATPYEARYETR